MSTVRLGVSERTTPRTNCSDSLLQILYQLAVSPCLGTSKQRLDKFTLDSVFGPKKAGQFLSLQLCQLSLHHAFCRRWAPPESEGWNKLETLRLICLKTWRVLFGTNSSINLSYTSKSNSSEPDLSKIRGCFEIH